MSIRRPRVLFRGSSNIHFSNSHRENYTTLSNHSQVMHQIKSTERGKENTKENIQSSRLNQRPLCIEKKEKRTKLFNIKQQTILQTLKNHYRNKINVKKILQGWKIATKGYLTAEEFQRKLNQNFGLKVQQKECSQLIQQFSSQMKSHLDIQEFLSMIYYQPENIVVNHRLYDFKEEKKIQVKIADLIQTKQCFNNTNKKLKSEPHQPQELQIEGLIKPTKNNQKNQLSSKAQFYLSKKKPTRTLESYSNLSSIHRSELEFSNSNLSGVISKTNRFKTHEKRLKFSPLNCLNQNQKKTRFNGILQQNYFNLGLEQDYSPQKKSQQVLKTEKTQNQKRYQFKLGRIRNYRKIEKEEIEKKEEKREAIDKANLMKRKLEQEVYNYATYIQNKWE